MRKGALGGVGVLGPRLRLGFGQGKLAGCFRRANKHPSQAGAAVIRLAIVAAGTVVLATAAQGRAWEWVEGRKKQGASWVASPRQMPFPAAGRRAMGRGSQINPPPPGSAGFQRLHETQGWR